MMKFSIHFFKAMIAIMAFIGSVSTQAFQQEHNNGASKTHLFILSGQSNMLRMDPEPSNIDGSNLPYDPIIAANYPDDSPLSFTPTLKAAYPNDEIIVVQQAKGGRIIDRWAEGNVLWRALTTAIDEGLAGRTFDTVTFVWMQGEADHADDLLTQTYQAKLENLYLNLQDYLGVDHLNWVIGRLNDNDMNDPNWLAIRDIQMTMADKYERASWVNFDDLNGKLNSVHLESSTEYAILGSRWANAAINLVNIYDLNFPPPAENTQTEKRFSASDFTSTIIDDVQSDLTLTLNDSGEAITMSANAENISVYKNEASQYGDSIAFSYLPMNDDFQLTAKVSDIVSDSFRGFAGIMVRSSLNPDASFVSIMRNKFESIKVISRHSHGNKHKTDSVSDANKTWFKLVRQGAAISAFLSNDKQHWQLIKQQGIASGEELLVGLASFGGGSYLNVSANYSEFEIEKLPQLSHKGGVYTEAAEVYLTDKNYLADYRYTLDGSMPELGSMLLDSQLKLIIDQDSILTISEYINGAPQHTWRHYFVISDENQLNAHYRPLHFSYGGTGGGSRLAQSDDELLSILMNTFEKKPTAFTPVILNEDPAIFEPFISQLSQIVPKLYFGVGWGKSRGELETMYPKSYDHTMALAKKFRRYSDAIRIENFSNILAKSGDETMDAEGHIVKLLNDLHALGFTEIMLNPWEMRPYNPDLGETYEKWPHVTATFNGTGKSKWVAPEGRINKMAEYNADMKVWVNYENAPRHIALRDIELAHQVDASLPSSIEIMGYVADRQAEYDALLGQDPTLTQGFKWAPPWSANYDPVALGTVDWIAEKLTALNP